jgi:beta-alanine degradation protein BauB
MPFAATIPAISTTLIDDAKTRVTRWDFEPRASTGWHKHGMDYVVVPMTDCHFLLEEAAGERSVFVQAGAAYARMLGVEHNVKNGGNAAMSFIEIEIK